MKILKFYNIILFVILLTYFSAIAIDYCNNQWHSSNENPASPKKNYHFLIKDYNGKIACFNYGTSEPAAVFDTKTDTLPQQDALLLKTGIPLYSEEELQSLLEDLLS